jgi:glycosyltransferase involved in cell wall biosynthesis
MQMTIAAVIPLYNGGDFIEEAILSVLKQTRPADEIIVVDDGSTDDGPSKVERLAAQHAITLLRKQNGGQSSARNLAIKHSQSEYIAFLDQDDVWYDDHLAILAQPFSDSQFKDLAIVYGNIDLVDRKGRMIARCYLDEIDSTHPKTSLRQCLSQDLYIVPSATLVAKEAISRVGYFDERLSGYEDDDLFVRIFWAGYRNIYLNTAVSRWRHYGGSSSFSARMGQSRMIYFKKLVDAFPDEPDLGLWWRHNIIGPRFMKIAFHEFIRASRAGDSAALDRAWSEIKQIAPVMNRRTRERVKRFSPLIERLYPTPLTGLARALARFAVRL